MEQEIKEGIQTIEEAFKPELTDQEIVSIIGKRIENGKTFYDKKLNLSKARTDNERRWMGENSKVAGQTIHEHQLKYEDNRIFVSVETLASSLVPRFPTPEVLPANDTQASLELAENFNKVLIRTAEDINLKPKLRMIARHLLMGYRVGVMKTAWDHDAGRRKEDGEFVGAPDSNWIRPHKIVFDADATNPYDIPLIAENMSCTLEELIRKFPQKETEIRAQYATTDKTLGSNIGYWEVWFTFYKDNKRYEGLAWKYHDTLLEWGLNPNFNYEAEEGSNFLEFPAKPYTLFNFLRIGRWILDDTSLTEQAAPLQDTLNKRGLQIVDNADQANAAKVFNTEMVKASDAENYVGDPNENILVKGDVRMAFARNTAPELPRYVVEDKYDARREIDNVFGTHGPIRGEKTNSPTLGQEIASQKADLGRTAALSEAIEEGTQDIYRKITQLYKVFASEENIVKYTGEEGSTTFIKFSEDKIEDGMEIRVVAGSLEPEDKLTDRNEAIELAKTGKLIDPLTFFEKWHLPKPMEHAKRAFYFLFQPDKYAQEILKIGTEGEDAEAMTNIQRMMSGDNVPPKDDATKEYIAYFSQFLQSPQFQQSDPEVQRIMLDHIKTTVDITKGGLKQGGSKKKKDDNVMSKIAASLKKLIKK